MLCVNLFVSLISAGARAALDPSPRPVGPRTRPRKKIRAKENKEDRPKAKEEKPRDSVEKANSIKEMAKTFPKENLVARDIRFHFTEIARDVASQAIQKPIAGRMVKDSKENAPIANTGGIRQHSVLSKQEKANLSTRWKIPME